MKPLLVLAATAALALSGCAATSGPGGGSGSRGATLLTIRVDSGPGTTARTYTLTCDPAGGTHPDAAAACKALAARSDPFAKTPTGVACTEIYGGPQRATITGTYRGRAVDAAFSRTDGCEIARWEALVTVLRTPGGVAGTVSPVP
jgi:hypothetical protein